MADNQPTTNLPGEKWKPVPGYEKYYEVSNMGRVRSFPRRILSGGRYLNRSPKIMKQKTHKMGHKYIGLYRGNGQEFEQVHRLVLEAFEGPGNPGDFCCHNDGNPANNHVSNLRWDTPSGNVQDMIKHGNHKEKRKTHCPRGHLHGGNNNPPSSRKRNKRKCRACDVANRHISRNPHLREHFQEIADQYFLKYTGKSPDGLSD